MRGVGERRPILLMDGGTREPVEATLIQDVSAAEVQAADALWSAFSQEAAQTARAGGVPAWELPEHRHWQWQRKMQTATPARRFFGVECQGEMQGLMAVRMDKLGRLPEQAGLPLVYVDYLATAPWNYVPFLALIGRAPRFRRSGEAMMQASVALSREIGRQGRIGLHALPQADSFYARLGMNALGIDEAYESLGYFEMTPEQASRMVNR